MKKRFSDMRRKRRARKKKLITQLKILVGKYEPLDRILRRIVAKLRVINKKLNKITAIFKSKANALLENVKGRIRTGFRRLFESPVRTYFLLALVVIPIVFIISSSLYEDEPFLEGILVEAHGMIFDVVVLGIIFAWLNSAGEKQRDIKRYKEEISDYLEWEAEEAKFRIVGNIKRLNRLGEKTNFSLQNAYLVGAKLREAHLDDSDFLEAKLYRINLDRAKLNNAILGGADMREAILKFAQLDGGTDLTDADLSFANFTNAVLHHTKLIEAELEGARFKNASLGSANLSKAHVYYVDLTGANLSSADFTEAWIFRSNFTGANLTNAKLNGTNFAETELKFALLNGADFTGSKLGANFSGAKCDTKTIWPEGFDPEEAGAILIKDV
jgi:uncharacterized protein YjbI with pentapeptide repeats